jgi:hypothetical protein
VLSDISPDGQEDALALVVASPVLMGFAEVAGHDGAFYRADNLAEGDVLGRSGQHISTADASLGPDQSGALEGEKDLLEIRLRQAGAFRDVPHRGGLRLPGVQRERQQCSTRIIASGRNLH